MSPTIRHLLAFFLQYGVFGLVLLAVADDSFLFLPVGSDLLTVVLVARDHSRIALCAFAAAAGSTIGVCVLGQVLRHRGAARRKRVVEPRRLDSLKRQMQRRAAAVLIVSCLAPPPFPFGAAIAAASALQYPRPRLLTVVFLARLARFALVGWSAIYFGRRILRIANSTEFLWFMGIFITFCLIGSVLSVLHWVRAGRSA